MDAWYKCRVHVPGDQRTSCRPPAGAGGAERPAFPAQAFWVANSRSFHRRQPLNRSRPAGAEAGAGITQLRRRSQCGRRALPIVGRAAPRGRDPEQGPGCANAMDGAPPFLIFGVWLGAALWWVARRLFEDHGGFVALALYCSSPAMVMIASNVGPEVVLAWSSFGLIYTAFGVAHTLYAPRRKLACRGLYYLGCRLALPWSLLCGHSRWCCWPLPLCSTLRQDEGGPRCWRWQAQP